VSNVVGWTKARYWQFIRSALRKAFNRYPPKYQALELSRRPAKKSGRHKWEHQCSCCKGWFLAKQVNVDHVIPAGSLTCYEDLAGFCERLFCSIEGLAVLCKTCHTLKTGQERSGLVGVEYEKHVWLREKTSQNANAQREELKALGYIGDKIKNQVARNICYQREADKLWKTTK
jgi:hypothetical protein